jgi:uncharacterized cysteine cluster protein YcgN (CxxCxxCC family)
MSDNSSEPAAVPPFWETKSLTSMTREEWESLCDGCGKCCLHKIEDADTGRIHYTNVACRLLNIGTCQCKDYADRRRTVPDCISLTPQAIGELRWLPKSCAYRLLAEGKSLEWWHPLVSGDPDSVHQAGISARGRSIPESRAEMLDYHIVTWPE